MSTSAASILPATRLVALAGNPNVGKTTIFNRLTGLRAHVGNYPGVTVEKKTGSLRGDGPPVEIIDVPGTYSLDPKSLDEDIAYRVLVGRIADARRPDLVVCIVDATNLERTLYLASQVIDLGIPTILVLNMTDQAAARGIDVDAAKLSEELGLPVIPAAAVRGRGIDEIVSALRAPLPPPAARRWQLDSRVAERVDEIAAGIAEAQPELPIAQHWSDALRAIASDSSVFLEAPPSSALLQETIRQHREELEAEEVPYRHAEITGRYRWITPLVARATTGRAVGSITWSDRIDRVLTHPIAGPAIFFAILTVVFQAVFAWAVPFMDFIDGGFAAFGGALSRALPAGPVESLLVDGAIAGVGAVVIFLPQILILFFFLGLLEDTGYMARAAFLMDRLMRRVGLSGRSVVPLLSGFACAIPAVMAARTIENERDRLVTILVTPLMTCSARLPVYTLLISAFVPGDTVLGIFGRQGLVLFGLYALGVGLAVAAAATLKRFVVRGTPSLFVLELPPYRRPSLRDVWWRMVERSKLFLRRAGTIIFATSVVLWFLAYYPRPPEPVSLAAGVPTVAAVGDEAERDALAYSIMGRIGHLIEPVIAPLGYDWKIGIALIASFAAREVAVSALGTIYAVSDADETSEPLIERLKADVDPVTGEPVFTPLVAASLMIFFVIAIQCMSTVAIVRRETGTWQWPLFLVTYLTTFAWIGAFVTYQGGRILGFG